MDNITNISPDMVTPKDVVDDLQNNLDRFKDLYCVAIDNEGHAIVWATGNLKSMAVASLALQAKCIDVLKDCHL